MIFSFKTLIKTLPTIYHDCSKLIIDAYIFKKLVLGQFSFFKYFRYKKQDQKLCIVSSKELSQIGFVTE